MTKVKGMRRLKKSDLAYANGQSSQCNRAFNWL